MEIDCRCIDLYLQKDEGAVTFVYSKTSRLLRHVAFSVLGDASLAEDAMMEAYVSTMDEHLRFPNGKAFVAYLCKATKNQALSMARKIGQTVELPDDEIVASPQEKLETGMLPILKRVLSSEDYDIMILHVCQGYSFQDIATFLDLGSTASVRGRYFRAKAKARDALKQEGLR